MLIVLFHLVALSHFLFGNYYGAVYVAKGDMQVRGYEFGGGFVYLTNINFVRIKFDFLSVGLMLQLATFNIDLFKRL